MTRHRLSHTVHSSRRHILFTVVALTLTLGCHGRTTAPGATQPITPDAAAIIDRHIEATGGRQAYAAVYNRVSKVRVVHVGMGFEDRAVDYEARPDKRRTMSESEAFGKTQSGVDGTLVWFLSENTGPVIEEGEARDAAIDGATFDRSVNWRKHYKDAEYVGEEVVGEKACHTVALTPHIGKPETRYYDKASGLLVKIAKTRLTSVGIQPTIPIEMLVEDYRPVGGLLIACKVTQTVDMCGSKHETIYFVESIRQNLALTADLFDPPAEVKAFAKDPARSTRVSKPGCKPASRPAKGHTSEDDSQHP